MIGIVGSGSWATALAQVLADNKEDVLIYGRNISEVDDININHRNSRFFTCPINENIKATTDLMALKKTDYLLLAIPSSAFEEVLNKLKEIIEPTVIINVAKGFSKDQKRLSIYIKDILKDKAIAIVSLLGPSHAEEVIERLLTSINAVSDDEEYAKAVQKLFANEYFRVYQGVDHLGSEIAASLKNVYAIASGIIVGLKQGDNAKAALMTRALAEMKRLGVKMGAKESTFLGLNGVGDLIVTCSSYHSRNFMAGLRIGQDDSVEKFLKENDKTVEGISACKIFYHISKDMKVEMPILNEVYAVLYENKKPSIAIKDLMKRELKKED